jgi:ubiquinone/menaquinone biosynthesis C-methylase UbiE
MKCSPNNVLEIGLDKGIVSLILKNFGFSVTTLDHSKKLCPDIVASVTDMPLDDGSFDMVLCCEVLEHIPYSDFEKALREIYRVTCKHLIITLPDKDRFYSIAAKLPLMNRVRRLCVECPFLFPKKHKYDGEHYWEIGKKGYSLGRICKSINNSGFTITSTYRMCEIPSQRIFVVRKSHIG